MPNIKYKDTDGSIVFIKCSATEPDEKVLVPEHKDSEAIDKLEELINALGKLNDTNIQYPRYINGVEGNPPVELNVIELLRCLNTGIVDINDMVEILKAYVIELKTPVGDIHHQPATYQKVIEVDEFGNSAPLSLISLAKGILKELYLLRTGVTT